MIDDLYDVAVIGAGMAGLSAAFEAARGEGRVVLLDARKELGGRARTRERGGYAMNEGAHALYVDGAAMAFLRELGREPAGAAPDAGAGIGIDGDLEGAFPVSARSLLRTRLLRGDRLGMARMLAKIPRMRSAEFADQSVDTLIRDQLGTGRAARLGHALFRLATYSNDPATTSADAGLVQLQMTLRDGVRYLDQGWQQMVDSLETANRDRGVEILRGTKVDGVGKEGVDFELTHSGGALRARRVIVAATPTLATGLLSRVAHTAPKWDDTARPAVVASLDVGFPDPWGDCAPFALGIDTPTYLSVHAPVADLAPAGHTLVHVMRYLPNGEKLDSERDRAECEALLDRVRPGWRRDVDHVSFRPHLIAATDQPSAVEGGLAGRPSVVVPDAEGLFIAGDWVGSEGVLVDASVASGRAAGVQATT